ncbi:MAG: hypothetical protein GY710_26260 [Desulfobacteraceae bacterium]|nr:hypothetical protein [Desulfobacteraceae bacterium]
MNVESEQIEGTLDWVFFNYHPGAMAGSFLDQQYKKFSALGTMLNPQIGFGYILTGNWEEHTKYGKQFKFSAYKTILPTDKRLIYNYIVRVRHVGPSVGNAIVDEYGSRTLEMLKHHPEEVVKKFPGITTDRAKAIQKTLIENEANEHVMIELLSILDVPGMRKDLSAKLIDAYKSDAAEMVKKNPYILTAFSGISFPLADRVALNIGFKRDSLFRKKSATMHIIAENMQAGSTWIYKDDLHIKMSELIQVPNLDDGVKSLVEQNVLIEEDDNYVLSSIAKDECLIADMLIRLEAA